MKKITYNEEFALDGRVYMFIQKEGAISLKYVRDTRAKAEFVPPSVDEVIAYFKENGYPEELAIQMHKAYSAAKEGSFIDGAGKPIKNWKMKAQNVWFRNASNNQQKQTQQQSTGFQFFR